VRRNWLKLEASNILKTIEEIDVICCFDEWLQVCHGILMPNSNRFSQNRI